MYTGPSSAQREHLLPARSARAVSGGSAMASEGTDPGLGTATATRRQLVRAGLSGALGLGTAAALVTPTRAAPAVLRGGARQTLRLATWFQSDPERKAAWTTL